MKTCNMTQSTQAQLIAMAIQFTTDASTETDTTIKLDLLEEAASFIAYAARLEIGEDTTATDIVTFKRIKQRIGNGKVVKKATSPRPKRA